MSHLNRTLMSELNVFQSGRPKSVNTLMHCLLKIPKGWPPAKATNLRLPHQDPHPLASSAQRFQMTKNPPKISSPDVISRIFLVGFQQICIISVSGGCTMAEMTSIKGSYLALGACSQSWKLNNL